uniref:Ciliary microtubule inner protein 7 n=1 Tax=Monodon monoceros TaxID=40151 RepID=A0A8C6BNZ0_MONMO
MQSALVGSWHNSGFYGHYRGQFKSESAREYRLAAKPQPPAVFLQRCQEPAQQHFFSKHDNRTSFDKEGPSCLLQGIGRRKDLERLWQQHTFLRWAPCELELRQPRPLESSYQADFRSGPGLSDLPQRLVHFVQIQPSHASTTYQQNFCQPSRGSHCGSDNMGPQAPVTNTLPDLPGIPRPKLLQHYLHAGVSECLNWSRTLNKDS